MTCTRSAARTSSTLTRCVGWQGSLLRYLDGAPDADDSGAGAGEGLRLLGSRPTGAAWLLDQLWSRLGFDAAITQAISGRRLDPGVERVLFALVANRAIAPWSKLAALELGPRSPQLSDCGPRRTGTRSGTRADPVLSR